MEIKICNSNANTETSAVLQTLEQLLDGNDISYRVETKQVQGTKGDSIIISIICSLAVNISSAIIYDLLKTAYLRRYGNSSSAETENVDLTLETDDKKENWKP